MEATEFARAQVQTDQAERRSKIRFLHFSRLFYPPPRFRREGLPVPVQAEEAEVDMEELEETANATAAVAVGDMQVLEVLEGA